MEHLLTKAEMTYEEVLNQWSQRGHLLALLQPEPKAPDAIVDGEVGGQTNYEIFNFAGSLSFLYCAFNSFAQPRHFLTASLTVH